MGGGGAWLPLHQACGLRGGCDSLDAKLGLRRCQKLQDNVTCDPVTLVDTNSVRLGRRIHKGATAGETAHREDPPGEARPE